MTMQTNTLPFQVTGANATTPRPATPDRLADTARSGGTGAFSATLNREMAARQPLQQQQPQAAAAQQSKPAQGAKPANADKPANREPVRENGTRATIKPPAEESEAKATQAASSDGAKAASDADDADDAAAAEAAAAAATTPVTDMLAFMASLTQPASTTASTDAALASTATEGDAQLTALETALDNLKAMTGDTTDDSGGKGLTLASGVQQTPAELRTTQATDTALPQGEQDAAQFQAQLRETQQQQLPVAEEAPAPLAALQAQAAKLDATGNPAAVPGHIPARLGTQAWDNQVSQRIVYMVGKEQAATLTLNPPDLGPVQIVLNVSNDQATVAFSSDQLEVRQALENAMPRLREMMSESGIALSNATVDANVPDQRQQQQDRDRRAQGGQGGAGGVNGDGQDATPAVNEVAPRTRTVSIGDRGMVDLFA
ncbi:flagellar hook-length control protein FliK [Massilia aurea]|uniref:flagellar hook-length control protein FliK n=1 Tax=Massilia aurea TaxID=373040 RepID=UPI0034619028